MTLKKYFRAFATALALGSGIYFANSELAPHKFNSTGAKTKGGYEIFKYNGDIDPKIPTGLSDISAAFDAWDETNGDNCKNTGSRNVRFNDQYTFIAANCSGAKPAAAIPTPVIPKFKDDSYTRLNYDNPNLQRKIKEDKFEDGFLDAVEDMCSDLDMHCMALLSVMDYESSFDPSIKNLAGSGATGLIQFMPNTAKNLGTSTKELAEMTQIDQLYWVGEYFSRQKRSFNLDLSDPVQVALGVFNPSYADNLDAVMFQKGSKGYRQNKGFDLNKDGKLTGREYAQKALGRGFLGE